MILEYREMEMDEAEKIAEIDAAWYIKNAWRMNMKSGRYELVEINWKSTELPNGYEWHLQHLKDTLKTGGKAFGCFEDDVLVGYATLEREIFGQRQKYVLLEQLFVSKAYRAKGIGKRLFSLCAKQAIQFGAEKIYLCAASAENTIAFYRKIGCKAAMEVNQKLFKEDPKDIPLEYILCEVG